jgi:hypothetical protein
MCGRGGLTFECVAGKSGGEARAFPCPTEQAARMLRGDIRVFCPSSRIPLRSSRATLAAMLRVTIVSSGWSILSD